jgi:hypothetical protein
MTSVASALLPRREHAPAVVSFISFFNVQTIVLRLKLSKVYSMHARPAHHNYRPDPLTQTVMPKTSEEKMKAAVWHGTKVGFALCSSWVLSRNVSHGPMLQVWRFTSQALKSCVACL